MLPRFDLLSDPNLVLETEKLNDYDFKFKIIDRTQPTVQKVFVVTPLKEASFVNAFVENLRAMMPQSSVNTLTKSKILSSDSLTSLMAEAARAFIFVQAAGITSEGLTYEPAAGTLCLAKNIKIRQYLRVNDNEMREMKNKLMVIHLREGQPIQKGRLVGQTGPMDKHVVLEDLEMNVREYVATEVGFFLVSKANTKSAGVFEKYPNAFEALNRQEYLAAEWLSQKKSKRIDSLEAKISHDRSRLQNHHNEVVIYDTTIKILQKTIEKSGQEFQKLDSLKTVLQDVRARFVEMAVPLGYDLQNDSVIRTNSRHKQTQDSKRELVWKLTDAEEQNRISIAYFRLDTLIYGQWVSILRKIVDNKNTGKPAANGLKDRDYEVLEGFYSLDDFDPMEGQGTWSKVLGNWTVLKYRYELISAEIEYQKCKELLFASQGLFDLLDKYAKVKHEVDSLMSHIKTGDVFSPYGKSLEYQEKQRGAYDSIIAIRVRIVKDSLDLRRLKAEQPFRSFNVEYASFEFNQGYIENVIVFGKVDGENERIKFANVMPIGFSRSMDYENLRKFDLWTEPVANGGKTQYSMNLGDLIENYQQNLAVNRRDYSPADGVKKFDLASETCAELKKTATYKLLEARVYSDFVGLDSESPNGLLQTEIGHRVNLITNRLGHYCRTKGGIYDRSKRLMYTSRNYWNSGWFGYVHPVVVISKIENNNRSLLLSSRDRIVNNTYFQERFASTMDLRNYEFLNTGLDLNIKTVDLPFFKSTFYFDLGFRFGRTQVVDSARTLVNGVAENTGKGEEFGVNTFRLYPKFIWDVKPEERYGLSLSYTWNQSYLWNPKVTQVAVPERFATLGENKRPFGFGTVELQGYFNPNADNPTGRLFFRYTYNHQGLRRWNTNFHQAQVGYSFYLLGRYKPRAQE